MPFGDYAAIRRQPHLIYTASHYLIARLHARHDPDILTVGRTDSHLLLFIHLFTLFQIDKIEPLFFGQCRLRDDQYILLRGRDQKYLDIRTGN